MAEILLKEEKRKGREVIKKVKIKKQNSKSHPHSDDDTIWSQEWLQAFRIFSGLLMARLPN